MHGAGRRAITWILPVFLLSASASTLALTSACGASPPPVEPEAAEAEPTPAPPPPPPPAPPPAPSLYERLGKRDALDGVVDDLLGNVLADKRINKLFEKARKDKDRAKQLHARFVGELCVLAGGTDCHYDGKSMKDAHLAMHIGEAQWNAFVEDLTIALKTHSVDDAAAKELIARLVEQTKADIVAPAKGK
ncbi:MAG: group I truncated hemoglobin [Polyangiaceae bacterium]